MEELFLGLDQNKEKTHIPIFHMVVTGQTQLSGKTTITKTLAERAVEKYGYKILVFDTKENIADFQGFGEEIPVVMRETTDSLILIGLAESIFGRRLTQYYSALSWITEDAKTLQDVIDRAKQKEESTKGWFKGACRTLWDILSRLQNQLEETETTDRLQLPHKINRMVLNYFDREAQQIFIKYALEDALRKYGKKLIVIIDEAFKFLPQRYSSACKKEIQDVITQGAGTQLYIWISTQFLAPTDKDPLKACAVRLLGTQDHDTEATHTLDLIPRAKQRGFDKDVIMTLPLGHFVTITKKFAKLTYAVPNGIPLDVAEKVVLKEVSPEYVRDNYLKKRIEEDDLVYKEKYEKLKQEFDEFKKGTDLHIKTLKEKLSEERNKAYKEAMEKVEKIKKEWNIEELQKTIMQLKDEKNELHERLRLLELNQEAITKIKDGFSVLLSNVESSQTNVNVSPEMIRTEIKEAIKELLPKTIDLEHVETTYNISHSEEPTKLTTKRQQGQIMFVALNDLKEKEFTETEMSQALLQRGWNIKHTSLAPTLGGLAKTGLLIRIPKTRPTRYVVPSKVKINVED